MSFVGGIKFVMMLEPFQRCWGNFSSLQKLKFSYKNCYYLPTKQELLLSNDFNSLLDHVVDIYSEHSDCTRSCNCLEDRSHSLTYKENAIEKVSIVSSWRNNLL
nr:hypothetical protein CFP56_06940 [Quercus suber]